MKIPRFEFTTLAIVECVLCVILLPIVIVVWTNAYYEMVYYRNFTHALQTYNGQRLQVTHRSVNRAIEALPERSYPALMKGQLLLEQKRTDPAKAQYRKIQDLSFDSLAVAIARLGIAICDLHQLYKLTTPVEKERVLGELEAELNSIIRDFPDLVDAMVALGHVYIHKARLAKEKRELRRAEREIKYAEQQFTRVLAGGDLLALPSKSTSYSLYVGLGIIHYWRAGGLLELTPNPRPQSPEAKGIVSHLRQCAEYLRSAWMYRIVNENLLDSIQKTYGQMLSFSWLTPEERRQIIDEATYYLKVELYLYKNHLAGLGERQQMEEWGLAKKETSYTRHLYNGLGLSYFFLQDLDNARRMLQRGEKRASTKVETPILRNLSQVELESANRWITSDDSLRYTKAKNTYIHEQKAHLSRLRKIGSVASLVKSKEIDKEEIFRDVNNYIAVGYYRFSPRRTEKEYYPLMLTLYENDSLPTKKFYIGVEQDPVTARQIVAHNLSYLYGQFKSEDEENKWLEHRLQLKSDK